MGNLPWSITEADLADAFRPHGTVISSRVITDKESGRSRGFGFVEVEDADAEKMIDALNGAGLAGRQLTVNISRPKGS